MGKGEWPVDSSGGPFTFPFLQCGHANDHNVVLKLSHLAIIWSRRHLYLIVKGFKISHIRTYKLLQNVTLGSAMLISENAWRWWCSNTQLA